MRRRFVGFLVAKRRAEKQSAVELQLREEIYHSKRLMMIECERKAAAIKIQRVFRGHRIRSKYRQFITDRRDFLSLKRVLDMEKRTFRYQLLDTMGFAPHLRTDTPREKVLKLFSKFHRVVAEECITDWEDAFKFLGELEEHHRSEGRFKFPPSYVFYYTYLQIVYLRKYGISSTINRLNKEVEALKLQVRTSNDRVQKKAFKKILEERLQRTEVFIAKVDLNGILNGFSLLSSPF